MWKIVFVCFLTVVSVQAGDLKRLVFHDEQSIADVIHVLQANFSTLSTELSTKMSTLNTEVSNLKAVLNKEVAALRTAIQTESKERCQVGTAQFHQLECPNHQGTCHEDVAIHFNPSFSRIPSVIYAIDGIDVDAGPNFRLSASVSHVTATGATLTVNTWADTKLYASGLSWIACPH